MLFAILLLVALLAFLAVFSQMKARGLEQHFPNIGSRTDVGGFAMNALHLPPNPDADLPPIVFIHGASGNLRDQVLAFRSKLEGRAELLFVDRPGHGYSDRGGAENDTPDGQANAIARLMQEKGIEKAIIVGHSFGGAITASFAVLHPDKVEGLIFLAAATHPWPGGVDWFYHVASAPVIGPIFSHTLALPAGLTRINQAIDNVFAPNETPDGYLAETGPALVLRPKTFRHNATDVAGLHDYVTRFSPRYREIAAPTVIITGDSDTVVLEEIHSKGLARDISGSELIWIEGVGHKPDYVANNIVIAAIEKIAGADRDLQRMARELEQRLKAGTAD
ncbi:alpha/beta hydrolase [Peteryoungia desertarenae]|uniref:Alpha/beta hydrolase n=1 Tax=Peteryoungia desertarenae TaxID=1813451 RepID=A0ABX6QRE6_9HYPH|nr:alpha/beta hydrolase [Peteryoungia desertarenae]QLF71196.1 alpha/beta hydrolase [Peteryoungia desertarenae]